MWKATAAAKAGVMQPFNAGLKSLLHPVAVYVFAGNALATAMVVFLLAQAGECLFSIDGLGPAALNVVVAGIEDSAKLRKLGQISRHCILHKLFFRASGLSGELIQLCFQVGR